MVDDSIGGLAIGGASDQKLAQAVTVGVDGRLLPVACDSGRLAFRPSVSPDSQGLVRAGLRQAEGELALADALLRRGSLEEARHRLRKLAEDPFAPGTQRELAQRVLRELWSG